MRMNLAAMDWVSHIFKLYESLHAQIVQNENVNCAHTSEHRVQDLRRPDRRTPMKVLVEKTFTFVELVWLAYIDDNKADIRHVLFILYCTFVVYMCLSIQYIVFREIEEEETSDTDREEVEDGAVLPEEESDDDDDDD